MSMSVAAPGRLELVRAFVNTRKIETGADEIAGVDALIAWLHKLALLGEDERASSADVDRVRSLREAVREALAANHDRAGMPAEALDVLNAAARRTELRVLFSADGDWVCQPETGGVDGAVGALLSVIVGSMADGTWPRLKVCVNDACRWAFYDTSRARTGKWCSMGVCGNRAKQRAWRARTTA